MRFLLLLACLVTVSFNVQAQEHSEGSHSSEHGMDFYKHHIGVGYLNTFIPKADVADGKYVVYAPAVMLEYEYRFNHKWSVLGMMDGEFAKYTVQGHEGREIERENIVIFDAAAAYKLAHNIQIFTGPGVELEQNENLFMWRFGIKNEFMLAPRWDMILDLEVDVNKEYTAVALGVGFGFQFGKKKHHIQH